MANYPDSIYSPRTKKNRAGVTYDETKETVIFAEDIKKLDDEVVAVETELGIGATRILEVLKKPWDDTGLVLYLPFEENEGTTAYDKSHYNYDGAFKGAGEPAWAEGKIGVGVCFDGNNDFIDCGNTGDNPSVSVEVWIKTTQTTGNWTALIKAKTATPWEAFVLRSVLDNPSNVRFGIWGGGTGKDATHSAVVNDGKWHHIVGTYDGSTIKLYIDGVKGTDASFETNPSNTEPLFIGKTVSGWGGGFFNGFIDEVRLYTRVLTADEVLRHYLRS